MSQFHPLNPSAIQEALVRIQSYIHRTPLIESQQMNQLASKQLNSKNNKNTHRIFFKLENTQKVGAFKARGAINTLLSLQEEGQLPSHVVAYSSGNHAQAVAWAAKQLGISATILIPKTASSIKRQATRGYGATVIETTTRQEAETGVQEFIEKGYVLIPPYDSDTVIAGQGTACLEALQDLQQDTIKPDAIFTPCGGGGLLSGTYLASQLLYPSALVFGAEPIQANDAAQSLKTGQIVRFENAPDTIADGVRTLAISERTFHYIQQLADIIEVSETEIIAWCQWMQHLLKTVCEPTSALGMAAAYQWLQKQTEPTTVLVIVSGGNLDPETQRIIWQENYLGEDFPRVRMHE